MKMPLQQLTIGAFRGSTQSVDIAFEDKPVIMIFGENGTGKSTIVDAIDFVCNEHAGTLEGRQSTPVKDYLPALGSRATDLRVELKWATKTWKATLAGSKAKVIGSIPRPNAKILRRTQILDIVDAQPAKRYEAFSRFVAVPNIEKAEGNLREADRTAREDFNTSARNLSNAREELRKLYREAGEPKPDLQTWAKSKNDTDPQDLNRRSSHISNLISLVDTATRARNDLSRAKGQETADTIAVNSITIDLQAAEEGSNEAKSDLLKLLDTAAEYLTLHEHEEQCPVCEQTVDRSMLLARLAARKAAGAVVAEASRKLDNAKKQEERAKILVGNEETRFLKASADMAKGFQASQEPSLAVQQIQWDQFTSLLSNEPFPSTPENLASAEALHATCTNCLETLCADRDVVAKELENLRAIKLQCGSVLKYAKEAKQLESLSNQLAALLSIVETARKDFVDNALDSIRQRVDALYSKLHPGENIGDIKLQLDPNRRGSLNVSSRFETQEDVPPQAYYSEAHLDTLGICIFIALAERDAANDTLLILDDVLTSADQDHIQRFIEMIHDEVKLPMLITTHYRPWRERYRYAKGPVGNVQLIELLSWSKAKGIRHTKTKLEIDELKDLLQKEPIDCQVVAAKSGVLLEAALREISILYRCKLPLDAEGKHTLGEYLNGLDAKLRKLMQSVATNPGAIAGAGADRITVIQPLLESLDAMAWIRNHVGAHFNLDDMTSTSQVSQFATATCALLDALICRKCGELPRKNQGSYFTCGCKAQQLHPLTSPGAQTAQIGN
jgi:energy-coupling factor transporter ATP-binding protein EcfA2